MSQGTEHVFLQRKHINDKQTMRKVSASLVIRIIQVKAR